MHFIHYRGAFEAAAMVGDLQVAGRIEIWKWNTHGRDTRTRHHRPQQITYGNTCSNLIKQEQWSLNKKKSNTNHMETLHTETSELLHMWDRVKKVVKDRKNSDLSFQCQTGVCKTPGSTCLFSQLHQPIRGCVRAREVFSEAFAVISGSWRCTNKSQTPLTSSENILGGKNVPENPTSR